MASRKQRIDTNEGYKLNMQSKDSRNAPAPPASSNSYESVVEPPTSQLETNSSEDDEEMTFETMSEDMATISGMIDNIESESQLASQKHRQLLERSTSQEQELQTSKEETVQLEKRVDEVSNQLQDRQKDLHAVSRKNQQLTDQLGASKERVEQANKSLAEVKTENDELNRKVEELRNKLHVSKEARKPEESLNPKTKKYIDLKEEIKHIQNENGLLQTRILKLEENQQSSLNEAKALIELNESLVSVGEVSQGSKKCVEINEMEQDEKVDDEQSGSSRTLRFGEQHKAPETLQLPVSASSIPPPPQNVAVSLISDASTLPVHILKPTRHPNAELYGKSWSQLKESGRKKRRSSNREEDSREEHKARKKARSENDKSSGRDRNPY